MSVPLLHASMVENLQKKLVQKDKEIAETNERENHKASLIRDLQKQLAHKQQETADTIERENQKAVTIRELRKELAQKEKDIVETNERENHNVLLIRDLQEKLAQKEKEVVVDTNERDLQEKLAQKDKEIAETNERENHKASLIRDLQKQLAHKKKEAADTIERENQKAVMIRELRKELEWEKNEHAALVRDFEKGNDELAQRIHSQPQVDGETWQFRGDSSEWISFPDCPNKELMAKFREGHECFKIVIDGRTYEIDFNKFSQKNVRTKKEREIRCFVDLPSHWQMTTEDALKSKFLKDSLQTPPLNSSFLQQPPAAAGVLPPQRSPIFVQLHAVTDQDMKSKVANLLIRSLSRNDGSHCGCLHGSSNFVVTEAYQVNNLHLWRRYQRCVRSIQDKHKLHGIFPESISPSVGKALTEFARDLTVDLAGNERLLLHGTRDFELARAIATEGFDNRVARDGLFGRGTYFAAQTCKSAQYATPDGMKSKASPQTVGTMLIARVAIGDPFYTPEPCPADLSRPPEKNGVRADSIIARPGIPNGQSAGVQSHMEVVTFDPGQAYPEFIVRFTEE